MAFVHAFWFLFKGEMISVGMRCVNLQHLKSWARRKLAENDAVRVAIESQPDEVGFEEFLVLFKSWDLMLATR